MKTIQQLITDAGFWCPSDPTMMRKQLGCLIFEGKIRIKGIEELAELEPTADERIASSLAELVQAVNSIGELLDNRLSSR